MSGIYLQNNFFYIAEENDFHLPTPPPAFFLSLLAISFSIYFMSQQ